MRVFHEEKTMNEINKERLAIELKTWLQSQKRFKTIRELEHVTGIPYSSLKDYFSGHATPPGERRRRLGELTRIPSLQPWIQPPRGLQSASSSQHTASAESVAIGVRHLMAALEPFKKGSAADRAALRKTVPARDVGYLTSLLKAMYDEDQFQTWLYFTEYTPESR
jgi:hypothetical protein